MRITLVILLLALAGAVHASATLRVGSHVLVAGDTTARVRELLGRPSHIAHQRSRRRGGRRRPAAERWEYRRHGHSLTLIVVDGRVTDIEQSLE